MLPKNPALKGSVCMNVIKTQWPEINTYLAAELSDDIYIRRHLRQEVPPQYKSGLYVCGQREARNVMRCYESFRGLEVWLEAQSDDARALLHHLPVNKRIFIEVGTPLGLELVQEELTGIVGVLTLFCIVDQQRFRPAQIHPVKKLEPEDRDALKRYPDYIVFKNRNTFFELFDEGKINLHGCYEKEEVVGYAAPGEKGNIMCVHVRPELRGQGYGRSLLSSCTEYLLKEHEMVFYDACMENIEHLRVCLAVGFVPLRQTFFFEGEKKGNEKI